VTDRARKWIKRVDLIAKLRAAALEEGRRERDADVASLRARLAAAERERDAALAGKAEAEAFLEPTWLAEQKALKARSAHFEAQARAEVAATERAERDCRTALDRAKAAEARAGRMEAALRDLTDKAERVVCLAEPVYENGDRIDDERVVVAYRHEKVGAMHALIGALRCGAIQRALAAQDAGAGRTGEGQEERP
jgi:hypothetical protein